MSNTQQVKQHTLYLVILLCNLGFEFGKHCEYVWDPNWNNGEGREVLIWH